MEEIVSYEDRILDLKTFTVVEYSITSPIGEIEERRYHQHVFGNVYETNERGERLREIGSIQALKLLIAEARSNNASLFDLFDITEDTMDLGERFWDFEANECDETLRKFYGDDIEGFNFLILTDLELIHDFRGKGLGKYLIKDVYNNFISGCGLFIADLQNDKIQEKNKHKLVAYLNLTGFEIIPSFSDTLMFINPTLVNKALSSIVLD
jgi:GNAT superfamily N-acetyltransferase